MKGSFSNCLLIFYHLFLSFFSLFNANNKHIWNFQYKHNDSFFKKKKKEEEERDWPGTFLLFPVEDLDGMWGEEIEIKKKTIN